MSGSSRANRGASEPRQGTRSGGRRSPTQTSGAPATSEARRTHRGTAVSSNRSPTDRLQKRKKQPLPLYHSLPTPSLRDRQRAPKEQLCLGTRCSARETPVHDFHPFQGHLTCRSLHSVPPLPARTVQQLLFLSPGHRGSGTAPSPLPRSCPSLLCSGCLTCCPLPSFGNTDGDDAAKSALCHLYQTWSRSRPVAWDSCSRHSSTSHRLGQPSCPGSDIASSKADPMLAFLQEGALILQVQCTQASLYLRDFKAKPRPYRTRTFLTQRPANTHVRGDSPPLPAQTGQAQPVNKPLSSKTKEQPPAGLT